jgi:hypothetical protein
LKIYVTLNDNNLKIWISCFWWVKKPILSYLDLVF